MNLLDYLKEYKALTIDIMEEINNYAYIEPLLIKREKILNLIQNGSFKENEIKKIGNELNLIKLENEMQEIIKAEKINLKKKIAELKRMEKGNSKYMNYSNINYSGINRINGKI